MLTWQHHHQRYAFLCPATRSGLKKMDETRKRRRRGNNRGGVSDRPLLAVGFVHQPGGGWLQYGTETPPPPCCQMGQRDNSNNCSCCSQLTFVHVLIFIITLVPISYQGGS